MPTASTANEPTAIHQASPVPLVDPADVLMNPELRAITDHVVASLERSFLAQAAHAHPAPPGQASKSAADEVFADNSDDLVGVHTPLLSLAASSNSYYQWAGIVGDSPRLFDLRFRGDGGSYLVSCFYKVYK